ncbi:BadF/BadG/BcrA/BcrD ATPase family protein [Oryzibacter oryziterrae]|uniref:BadF/BadG/BcrA/BcrD ATPase family protein n=1 Tax=Oryzibacter oryziterrae TaxID=2766474 RepID=UPI001F27FF8D|nr:BadF/BadG/BcrA/BcrD ATPase family protein [Oryzibacter oryziterrae]
MPAQDSPLFLGIDGGGTNCRARISDADGITLGSGTGGPSNITTDLDRAAQSILTATRAALAEAGLTDAAFGRVHAVLGMAGGNSPREAAALTAWPFGFAAQMVTSDAETACVGAHDGQDGAILILGTGSQGYGRLDGESYRVGGWGFALSDGASGAVVGHRAARRALLGFEGIKSASPFTDAIMARFDDSETTMLAWALKAIPRDWAEFAPMVFTYAEAGDPVAIELRTEAVSEVEGLVSRLVSKGAARIALVGGLAAVYRPHLAANLSSVLTEPLGNALDGALRMARGLKRE